MSVMLLALLCVMFSCFLSLNGVLGQVCYLIVSALIFAIFLTLVWICELDTYLEIVKKQGTPRSSVWPG